MINAVVDTNVLISALIGFGNPRKILQAFSQREFLLVTSSELIEEFNLALSKPKIARRITDENREAVNSLIKELARIVEPKESVLLSRDVKDDVVLECALAGDANFIVTGDDDLLVLENFCGIPIITPKIFLTKLKKRF